MTHYVVDENVPLVANGSAKQADIKCRLAVIQKLEEIIRKDIVVIDDEGEIFKKYRSHHQLSMKGQPGTGDAFLRHIYVNQYNPRHVERVGLEKNASGEWIDFPKTAEMKGFHKDDQIFIALSIASKLKPIVLNAVDSDYKNHKQALLNHDVKVEELCPHCLKKAK